jgi:hypothetical protein
MPLNGPEWPISDYSKSRVKADAQNIDLSGGYVPTTDTDGLDASDNLRPGADAQNLFLNFSLRHIPALEQVR